MEDERAVRIFVGGLGESVGGDDVRKIFSSLGVGGIGALQIIRTKGRSFAYFDFFPSSPNSLAKLFSTYNGCVWKGVRLRVERAKPHYLDRLKHEWAQDALLLTSAAAANTTTTTTTTTNAAAAAAAAHHPPDTSQQPKQLRIFFPSLRKVKSIPFTGTGKHKYSFRRVPVPSIPTHFCDCQDHSSASASAPHKQNFIAQQEDASGGMNDHEINIMNSVMHKLFQKDSSSISLHTVVELGNKGEDSIQATVDNNDHITAITDEDGLGLITNMVSQLNPIHPVDYLQPRENEVRENEVDSTEDDDDDDDDFITNLVSRQHEMAETSKDPTFNEIQSSNNRPTHDVPKKQNRNSAPLPNKNRKLIIHQENSTHESVFLTGGTKGSHPEESGTLFGGQHIDTESGIMPSTPSLSWSQRSTWRELVAEKGNNAFNISDILGTSSGKEQPSELDSFPKPIDSEKQKVTHPNRKEKLFKPEVVEVLEEAEPTKPASALNHSGRGSSWLHKSSWMQLVSGNNSSTFSITQILPGTTYEKQEAGKSDGVKVRSFKDIKHGNMVKECKNIYPADGTMHFGVGKVGKLQSSVEISRQIVSDNAEVFVASVDKQHNLAMKQALPGVVAAGDDCSFMRTAASLKEWAKTKAALSGSRKRKSYE